MRTQDGANGGSSPRLSMSAPRYGAKGHDRPCNTGWRPTATTTAMTDPYVKFLAKTQALMHRYGTEVTAYGCKLCEKTFHKEGRLYAHFVNSHTDEINWDYVDERTEAILNV